MRCGPPSSESSSNTRNSKGIRSRYAVSTLQLARSRWSNEAGYETSYLHVTEIDGDGRISYYGRFDEDDFEGAYRELDRRYYAGEGAAFAEAGAALTEWMTALNRGDLDRVVRRTHRPGHALRNPFEFSVS